MGIKTAISLAALFLSYSAFADLDTSSAKNSLDSIDSYVTEKSSLLAVNKRENDPFGQPTDPHVKKAPTVVKQSAAVKTKERIAIEKEIEKLSEKISVFGSRFTLGNDSYGRRETLTVMVKNKGEAQEFELKIISINRNSIKFMNLSDENRGIFNLDLRHNAILSEESGTMEMPDSEKTVHEIPQN